MSKWARRASRFINILGDESVVNPSLIFDIEDGIYYWDGAAKSIGDATSHGDGSYTITTSSWWAATHVFMVEYTIPTGVTPTGTLFSWTNASNQRLELLAYLNDRVRVYFSQGNQYAYPDFYQLSTDKATGRRRVLFKLAPGVAPITKSDGCAETATGSAMGSDFVAPTKFSFGRNARFNNGTVTDVTVHKVYAWASGLTYSQRREKIIAGNFQPIHCVGDSFLGSGTLQAKIAALCTSDYVALSQDGVGGTSLTQQAVRFAATPEHWSSVLLIIDGGLDGTQVEALAAIADMVGRLTHSNWFYMQSNPQDAAGSRPTWDAIDAAILAYAGATHYIETKTAMKAANNGDANDLTDVANDIWPRSLRADATHLNAAGETVMAGIIHDHIEALGMMPT